MSSSADWGRKIGVYAREQRQQCSDIDKDLQNQATSGQYGYDASNNSGGGIGSYNKSDIYQGYGDGNSIMGGTSSCDQPDSSESTRLNEGKDSYDAIDLEASEEDDRFNKGGDETSEQEDPPITKKLVIELLVCILAFVGRGLCLNSVGPTLIDLRQITGMSIPESAWVFVSQSTGFLIGSVLAKIILQKFNNELALGASLAVQAVCSALIPAFKSKVMMCLMFMGQGYAIGVVGIGVCSTCIRLGGKQRNGMFLQAAYLGVSIGSVLGPFIARPFLSSMAREKDNHDVEKEPDSLGGFIGDNHSRGRRTIGSTTRLEGEDLNNFPTQSGSLISLTTTTYENLTTTTAAQLLNGTTAWNDGPKNFTETHVQFYYVIMGLVLSTPALAFFMLYFKRDKSNRQIKADTSKSDSLAVRDCTVPLVIACGSIFMQCLIYFGTQDTYSNLLTTYAVLGPLELTKTKGVYLTSLFWASMCFGRLNGIWVAKLISPFKILLIDMILAMVAAFFLMALGGKASGVLWGFTVLLGLSFATINGATVSWASQHLPENNYILSMIMIGRCVGLLLLPTSVTALFKLYNPMILMYAVFGSTCIMLTMLLIAQFLATKFGVQGRLRVKSHKQTMHEDD